MHLYDPAVACLTILALVGSFLTFYLALRRDLLSKDKPGPASLGAFVAMIACTVLFIMAAGAQSPAQKAKDKGAAAKEARSEKADAAAFRKGLESRYKMQVIKWDSSPSEDNDDKDLFFLDTRGRLCTATWITNDQKVRYGLNANKETFLTDIECEKATPTLAQREVKR